MLTGQLTTPVVTQVYDRHNFLTFFLSFLVLNFVLAIFIFQAKTRWSTSYRAGRFPGSALSIHGSGTTSSLVWIFQTDFRFGCERLWRQEVRTSRRCRRGQWWAYIRRSQDESTTTLLTGQPANRCRFFCYFDRSLTYHLLVIEKWSRAVQDRYRNRQSLPAQLEGTWKNEAMENEPFGP